MVWELLQFENPDVVAIALGALVFVVIFWVFSHWIKFARGPSALMALAAGGLTVFYVFRQELEFGRNVMAVALIIAALFVIFLIGRAFFRFFKHHARS